MSVCLSANLHDPEKCDFKIRGKKRLDVKVSNEYPSVRVLDMTTSICPDGVTCPSLIGGLPIYRDNSHMSNSFSKTLDQDLQAALEYMLK